MQGWKEPLVVFLLEVGEFLADNTEILEETFLPHLVLARNIGLAEGHEVINVIAGIIHKPAHG